MDAIDNRVITTSSEAWVCPACLHTNKAGRDNCARCLSYIQPTPQRVADVRWSMEYNAANEIKKTLGSINSKLTFFTIILVLYIVLSIIGWFLTP